MRKKKRERIVPTAGVILLEDMQLMAYDTTVFPPSDNFCSGAEEMVPQTLKALMDSLSGKKRDDEKMRKKLTAIAHAIISTIRPRSFLSPILHDIADFNVATLDGLNTFHSMRGIKCITPSFSLPPALSIKRLKSVPTAEEIGKLGVLELLTFENVKKSTLQQIVV
ncbi:hypothetical protein AVEN_115502-1 [Araneus ventricosus]|uniref:Uncharacterized protein n=1 Tax=Araneus ventricosus TaxID=182803 RepID=A0A4Y2XB56_ARAVE|nr:hypothetical protein AVEN_115502-1 [Araneus ventricosus]